MGLGTAARSGAAQGPQGDVATSQGAGVERPWGRQRMERQPANERGPEESDGPAVLLGWFGDGKQGRSGRAAPEPAEPLPVPRAESARAGRPWARG